MRRLPGRGKRWREGEEEVESARALLDLHRSQSVALSVLDLTAYEVGNALLRGVGVGAAQASAVLNALDRALLEAGLGRRPSAILSGH